MEGGIDALVWIVYTKKKRWAVDIDEDLHCHGVSYQDADLRPIPCREADIVCLINPLLLLISES